MKEDTKLSSIEEPFTEALGAIVIKINKLPNDFETVRQLALAAYKRFGPVCDDRLHPAHAREHRIALTIGSKDDYTLRFAFCHYIQRAHLEISICGKIPESLISEFTDEGMNRACEFIDSWVIPELFNNSKTLGKIINASIDVHIICRLEQRPPTFE